MSLHASHTGVIFWQCCLESEGQYMIFFAKFKHIAYLPNSNRFIAKYINVVQEAAD